MSRLTDWLRRWSRRDAEREVKDAVRAIRAALTPDEEAALLALARDLVVGRASDAVGRDAVDLLRAIGTRRLAAEVPE